MKIAILGSGGREHAIAESISKSKILKKLYCIPGNAGTNLIAENINIDLDDFSKIKNFIKEKDVEIVIIGPEKPLVEGIADFLEKEKIKVFGPNKFCSQLEGSKTFTKLICKKLNISEKTRVNELSEDQVLKIREFIDTNHNVEGDLRREISVNIKRLVDLATYRGSRHKKKLPVRGQRTHCNARTRKGKAIAIAGKKLTPLKK